MIDLLLCREGHGDWPPGAILGVGGMGESSRYIHTPAEIFVKIAVYRGWNRFQTA